MGNLVFQATLGGQVNLVGPNTASTYNINVPTVNGNMVTTGDTGTVTNTMCATSVYTAPGTIGSGTPNTGAFTTLSASGVATISAGSASAPALTTSGDTNTGEFFPAADTIAWTTGGSERLRLDSSGNLGLGVTPSTWSGGFKAFQYGATGAIAFQNNNFWIGNNWVYNSGDKYIASDYATLYSQQSGQHQWYRAASGTAGNAITFTQAMTLDASGQLAIGTTTANSNTTLTLNRAGFNQFYMQVGGTNKLSLYADASISAVDSQANPLVFYTNSAERARIDSSGRFLIGQTSTYAGTPGASVLQVSNSTGGNQAATFTTSAGSIYTATCMWNQASTGYLAYFLYGGSDGTNCGSISYNGTLTVYSTTSDQRLKENIIDAGSGIAKLSNVKIRSFDWIDSKVNVDFGVVAQELYEVAPECVSVGVDNEDGSIDKPWAIDTSALVPAMIKAIQEQQAIITQLQADVAALKG